MDMLDSLEDIEKLISENQIVLVYFGSDNCGVCTSMKPKIEGILRSFPKIKSAEVNSEKAFEVSAAYSIFTIPGILIFIEGKEIIREARHISVQEVKNRIDRYYKLLFE